MSNRLDLGKKVKEFRVIAGLSQRELAEELSLETHTISAYETDRIRPSIDVLERMADVLNVKIHSFFLTEETINTNKENKETVFNSQEVLSKNLKFYRAKIKMTQLELAEKINVVPASISFYEANKGSPSLATLDLLAQALNITPSDLLATDAIYTPNDSGLLNALREQSLESLKLLISILETGGIGELKKTNKILKEILNL